MKELKFVSKTALKSFLDEMNEKNVKKKTILLDLQTSFTDSSV